MVPLIGRHLMPLYVRGALIGLWCPYRSVVPLIADGAPDESPKGIVLTLLTLHLDPPLPLAPPPPPVHRLPWCWMRRYSATVPLTAPPRSTAAPPRTTRASSMYGNPKQGKAWLVSTMKGAEDRTSAIGNGTRGVAPGHSTYAHGQTPIRIGGAWWSGGRVTRDKGPGTRDKGRYLYGWRHTCCHICHIGM